MPFLAAAAPWVLSTLGAMVPQIIDAFRTSKTPEEVQKSVQPRYDELVQRMVGGGMSADQAHNLAQEMITPEMEKAAEGEPMNPLLAMGLSALGGVGGWKAGVMAGKGMKNMGRASALAKRRADPARAAKLKTASSATPKAAASKVGDLDDAAVKAPKADDRTRLTEFEDEIHDAATREAEVVTDVPHDYSTGAPRPRRIGMRAPVTAPFPEDEALVKRMGGFPKQRALPAPRDPREDETAILPAVTALPPGRREFAGQGDFRSAVARKARDPHEEDLAAFEEAMASLERVPGDD